MGTITIQGKTMIKLMTGTYEYLTIKEISTKRGNNGTAYWWCACICGKLVEINGACLRRHRIRSCGCKSVELIAITKGTTYRTKNPAYGNWRAMKSRCDNGKYKGKGIKICERWLHSFDDFIEDMGPKPSSDHTIERNDSNGNYEPGNCYWATIEEQNANLSHNHIITYDGKTQTISQWAREKGMKEQTLMSRLDAYEWSTEKALTTPVGKANYCPPKSGRKDHPEYTIWVDMKRRCNDKHNRYYGGKGIKVCERWLHSFDNFLEDMGSRPSPLHSIDRYPDMNGNYEPTNCRWATRIEQNNRNIKRENPPEAL